MKTYNPVRQRCLKAAIAVFLAMCVLPGVLLAVGTNAGERIQNQATATYVDANLNPQSAQSNIATVEVGQVYSATLAEDRSLFAASGQSVNFAHVLANTGNGEDTYTISLSQILNGAGDNLDFDNLAVYIDQNGDGVATAGETLVANAGGSGAITLQADTQVDLVVLAKLPASSPGQTAGALLTATPTNGIVDDLTAANGTDGLEGTNQDLATVTDNAVLNVNKSSTYNNNSTATVNDDTVTFIVTITNTGPVAAYNVEIQDTLDLTKFDVTAIGDIIINATEGDYVDVVGNASEGAAVIVDTINGFNPVAVNDANNDTTTGDFGVRGHDDKLAANETVSFTYTVPVIATLPAGTILPNSVHILGDVNDNGDKVDPGEDITSNTTTQIVPQEYGVDAADTGGVASPGVNDGSDDDSTANDIQYVNTAASGEQVLFANIITNEGNGTDTFELSVVIGNFPVGTVFSFWHAGGTTALLDTNDNGTVDTGPMAAGAVKNIMVKAQLPAGAYGAGFFDATMTALSAGDGVTSDTKTERLFEITAPGVDLSNEAAIGASTPDGDPGDNENEYGVGDTAPATLYNAAPGAAVNIPLTIQNDSGVPDSFQLTAGGTWNGAVLGSLSTGWSYGFKNTSGTTITTTPAIPAGGSYSFYLRVVVPSNPIYALANFSSDIDGDGSIEEVDGPTLATQDGDYDYPIFIRVTSTNTGASDIKMDAVDVTDSEKVTLLANQTGQIQPGGSIGYPHTLRNDGNTAEAFTLSAVNSLSAAGWGHNVLVDTTGDGNVDTPISTLTNETVWYTNAAGVYASQVFGQTVANSLVFQPGEKLDVTVLEFAPSSAPDGTLDILTITARYNLGASQVINIDQTTVIQGQIRLTKTVAVDADCNDVADAAFAVEATSKANPGECVSWRLIVTNEGTAPADNVIIYDTVPAFSDYVPGSLLSGAGDFGTTADPGVLLIPHTDADDAEGRLDGYTAKVVGDDITFELGTIATGASVTLQFQTTVQ
ncbi:MAG: DUF11 domain-containing protein [Desulfatibacillum sp.]|nr:DUF11 domain-containing protein [Desulfatibacillum sp.]